MFFGAIKRSERKSKENSSENQQEIHKQQRLGQETKDKRDRS